MSPNPSGCTVAAILLLIGAKLVIDPGATSELEERLTLGIRNFHQEIRGIPWRTPWKQFHRRPIALSRRAARLWGIALIALGLLLAAVS